MKDKLIDGAKRVPVAEVIKKRLVNKDCVQLGEAMQASLLSINDLSTRHSWGDALPVPLAAGNQQEESLGNYLLAMGYH